MKKYVLLATLIIYTALIVYYSLFSSPVVSPDPGDFSLHLLVYFFYGVLCFISLSPFIHEKKNAITSLIIFSVLDFSLELLQPYFGRHCDIVDAILGFAGGSLGVVFGHLYISLISEKNV